MTGIGAKTVIAAGAALLFVSLVHTGPAAAAPRSAAIVLDANSGKVLHEQDADAPRHPASLTKMMTLYLAFEAIEQGKLSYSSRIVVSAAAAGVAPSKLDLKAGEEIELIDAIKALITKSANDMAVAIAEQIGGSHYGFVRLMNERARQIGMRATVFANASGLPDTRQVTTARDMVILALRLQDDFPKHYPLFALKSFDYHGKTYRTHNTLMAGFPGMDGVKTGYTRSSGFNLVSSVRTDGKHLVAAVFGGVTASARNAHMRLLLYRALEKAATERTRKSGPLLVAQPALVERPESVEAQGDAEDEELPWQDKPVAAAEPKSAAPKPAAAPRSKELDKLIAKVAAPQAEEPAAAPSNVAAVAAAAPAAAPSQAAQAQDAAAAASDGVGEAPPSADATPPPAAIVPKLDLEGLRTAMAEAPSDPLGSAAPSASAANAVSSPSINALLADSAAQSARAPSTLDGQAKALAASVPPQQTSIEPPAKPAALKFAAAPAGLGFEIQIGAYGTSEEAERRMATAKERAPGLLNGHAPVAVPVQRNERQVFRARFTGFSEADASNACLELRRLSIDCFVMQAE